MDPPLVQITAHGPTSAATRLWRFRGQLRVTVIVKATFTLVHQAMMKIAPPDPIITKEAHHGDIPVRSVRLTDDLAPYLPGTDVLLTGHAHAPPGTRAPWVTAGIALYDKYDLIFEKYLDVRGNPGPEGVEPFQKMPLLYERAFGGPGWEDNPFGVGTGGARGEPNVFYIGDRSRSAGFAPISVHMPARKKLVTAETRKALARPIADIPEGFDWSYFHAAPRDQRCAFLMGTEWVVLQGLRPDERRVRSRLPAVRGLARVSWVDEQESHEPVELTADTLRIDADRGTGSVTWRKSFAVEEESQLSDLAIVAAVQIGDQPVRWPAPPPPKKAPPPRPATEPLPGVAIRPFRPLATTERMAPPSLTPGTIALSDEDLETVSVRSVTVPLEPAPAREEPAPAREEPAPTREEPAPPHAPAPAPPPMILGAFRLAVFSPQYQDDPDDPLLSTLVIRDRRPAAPGAEDSMVTTLVMRDRPAPVTITPLKEGVPAAPTEEDDDADSMARTLVVRRKRSQTASDLSLSRTGATRASPAAAARRFPKPPGARLWLDDLAALAAALAETDAPRAEVLSAHDISEREWLHDERLWSEAFHEAGRRGDTSMIQAFDAAYVAAWEAIRGPVSVPDYACLSIAAERGDLTGMLALLKLRRATWRRVRRVWAQRIAEDSALAQAVRDAVAALR